MYGSLIWASNTLEKIYQLEKIQHQVLRIFVFKNNIDFDYLSHGYASLYKKFNMHSLESAKEISDLKFLYKLFNNQIDANDIKSVMNIYEPKKGGLRTRYLSFTIPIEFKNNRKTSFLLRILENYNINKDKI